MGKQNKTIYFCDLCGKESVTRINKCPFCGRDFCRDCGLDVGIDLHMANYQYKRTKNYYNRVILINEKFYICDGCREELREIKEAAIRIIDDKLDIE